MKKYLPLICGISGEKLTTEEIKFFRDYKPWGIILFERNCINKDNLKNLTKELKEINHQNIPILIDQEGGRVSRLNFKGVKRRFTLICETKGIKVFDDYAHHPKEIVATLSALKKITSGRIIAIHEPHRYSRLNDLFNDFTKSFNLADKVFFLPVFPAGEKPIKNISSNFLLKSIKKNRGNYSYVDNEISLHNALVKIIKKNDCVIFLGAGPISKLAYSFARKIHS